MTVGDVVEFVESVPRGKAFPSCTREDIIALLKEAFEDDGLIVFTSNDTPVGVLLFRFYENTKHVWVKNMLCHPAFSYNCLKKAFKIYKERFPGCKLTFNRHERFKSITPSEKFIKTLTGE